MAPLEGAPTRLSTWHDTFYSFFLRSRILSHFFSCDLFIPPRIPPPYSTNILEYPKHVSQSRDTDVNVDETGPEAWRNSCLLVSASVSPPPHFLYVFFRERISFTANHFSRLVDFHLVFTRSTLPSLLSLFTRFCIKLWPLLARALAMLHEISTLWSDINCSLT